MNYTPEPRRGCGHQAICFLSSEKPSFRACARNVNRRIMKRHHATLAAWQPSSGVRGGRMMVNARDRMLRVFVGVALLGATLPETDASWLSPSTGKRFQDSGSKAKGTSSLSQNSRLGVSMVILTAIDTFRLHRTIGPRGWHSTMLTPETSLLRNSFHVILASCQELRGLVQLLHC